MRLIDQPRITRGTWQLDTEQGPDRMQVYVPTQIGEIRGRFVIADQIGGEIYDSGDDYAEVKANAVLIQSAPQLLRSLISLVELTKYWQGSRNREAIEQAEAAIQAATRSI